MNRFFAPLVAIALLAGCDKLKGGARPPTARPSAIGP